MTARNFTKTAARIGILLAALGAVSLVAVTVASPGSALDARATACGAANRSVLAAFPVSRGADVRTHLPKMAPAPELDTSSAPAYVVVFNGPVDLPVMGFTQGAQTRSFTGVVCVLIDSIPEYYFDVDASGWHP